MAKQVSGLTINLQSGTDSTYYASWSFTETTTTTSSGIEAGDLVSIKSGATYYNGVSIPSWVMSQKWYVTQVSGDRAVLGKNASGSNNINSPINTKYLTGGSGSSTSKNTLDHYEVKWYYATGDGVWFTGGTSDVNVKNATYSVPANATKVKVTVKPVSKTYKSNNKDVSYWTGTSVSATKLTSSDPPADASAPTVVIEKYQLTASLENISDARTDKIQFAVYNGTTTYKTGIVKVVTCRASFSCTVAAGGEYRVRCRAINLTGNTEVYGEWSSYSSATCAIPKAPSSIKTCKATSATSVYLEWASVSTAESYDIEFTTNKNYFDGSDSTTTITGIEFNHYEKTGLETGQEYFFRVRAVNENDASAWSGISSVIVGKDPAAPTTWSSTTTAIVGETLNLYWVHNAADGSSQTYAELELYINGVKTTTTIQNSTDEDEKDLTSSYTIPTSSYVDGTTIQWRVRTAGITNNYGDWSVQRTIDVYAPPTLELSVTDSNGVELETLTTFPIYISGFTGPNTQTPIGYHVTVVSNETYITIDDVGNEKTVNAGDQVYSNYFDTSSSLLMELSANNIDLENNVLYTVTCTASMNSGLTVEESTSFTVSWTDELYELDAEISIDKNTLTAYIRPYCVDDDGALVEGVTLSVYRREFDGTFTEIATGLSNVNNTAVTDPHPALDYARYRIVAITDSTGAVSYYDMPGQPTGEKAAVIQWDEAWSNYNTTNTDVMEDQPWTGSMLKLPYNLDVTNQHKNDVALIEYIGHSHPVSYYGTQLGETMSLTVDIEKNDEDTLYALRRLAKWMGDVYVREPSGSGYWANVSVSFSQTHCELTIPVSLEITRVEGGV